ncbi:unnamed protein product, partial [Nesidiocoris tenuis]
MEVRQSKQIYKISQSDYVSVRRSGQTSDISLIRRQTVPLSIPRDIQTSDWLMLWLFSLWRTCINDCYRLSIKPCFSEKLSMNLQVKITKEPVCTDGLKDGEGNGLTFGIG